MTYDISSHYKSASDIRGFTVLNVILPKRNGEKYGKLQSSIEKKFQNYQFQSNS